MAKGSAQGPMAVRFGPDEAVPSQGGQNY